MIDESFSYFLPNRGGEHQFKAGGGLSFNRMPPRTIMSSGAFTFRTDAPYNAADPSTYPVQFDMVVGPPDPFGYSITSKDRRQYAFVEDKW